METRQLGHNGPQVSIVGLGCNNFGGRIGRDATRKVIDKAIDLGINHFDTADVYGGGGKSEDLIGELLGADRRKRIVLATKFGKMPEAIPGVRGRAVYVRRAAEASLRRLRTDYIDLYYMHEPDPKTPVDETLDALETLRKEGKIRHIATSNFNDAEVTEALAVAKKKQVAGFTAAQDEYSLLARGIEKELLPTLDANGLDLIPYFPLGGGALTGKYRQDKALPAGSRHATGPGKDRFLEPHWDTIEALHDFAEKRGHSILHLAFSWLAHRPRVVSIIAGATRPEQLEHNVKATAWNLTPAEMTEIDRITA